MKDLRNIRAEIDAIDSELVRLFRRRLEVVGEVAASKHERGAPVTDPARERDILSRVSQEVGEEYAYGARLFFSTLFGISKARQRALLNGESGLVKTMREAAEGRERFPERAVVACAGAEGSYAQQAASLLFPLPTILYFTSFEKVFEAVEKGFCAYGILPVENSAAGSVTAVYDLMERQRFHIVRALRLKVDHVLLGARGARLEDVREITSHPHALAQCRAFLRSLPKVKATPGPNTAVAAKELAESGRRDLAVVASRACAELYGLDVIKDDIMDAAYNYTRFVCISKDPEIWPDARKFTVTMRLPHRPGALNTVILKFASIGVNLTKLESRPIPGTDFEFRFIFDFEASPSDPAILALLSELSQDPEIERFAFLGAYAEK